eukprot:9475442-Pyramimonas_sp.AAC.1
MRLPQQTQRFVGKIRNSPKVPVAVSTCVFPTQYGTSWPHRVLHLRSQWGCPHASPPPNTALRGSTGSSTQGTSGGVHMRLPHPTQRFVTT